MSAETLALLVLAGVGTGMIGYLTGLASLISYPALLAAGLSPVAANVTQTLSLIGIGIGATAKALGVVAADGHRTLMVHVSIAGFGGLLGATLLLLGGEGSFEAIVPWLILGASLAVVCKTWLLRVCGGLNRPVAYNCALFLVCVYGGYFGAGAGTMYLAVALLLTGQSFMRSMVMKSALLAMTNLSSALLFIALGPVHWGAAISLGVGCLLGGVLGPVVQRWTPEIVLRWGVGSAGAFLALWLWAR